MAARSRSATDRALPRRSLPRVQRAPARPRCLRGARINSRARLFRFVAEATALAQQFDELSRGRAERAVAAVDDADRARPLRLGQGDDGQLAAAPLVAHAQAGHYRQPEADLDGPLDRLDVVELGD